jgi:hypothetical protein
MQFAATRLGDLNLAGALRMYIELHGIFPIVEVHGFAKSGIVCRQVCTNRGFSSSFKASPS